MSSSTFKKLGESELLPRYIFAESLFARRRVLELGAVASTLGQSARFLSTRGARIVVAADSDLSAVQDAQSRLAGPNLRFRAPVFDDLEAGSFDLVIVADLATYVRAPELLKDLVRLVAKNGYLMGGLRNPAGLSLANVMDPEGTDPTPTYGQLLDALTTHFRSIEVATQSPVLGYQLAFEKGEGLQVDGSLAGTAEAAYYVVLAGHEPVRFFDPTWVQLPPEPLAFTGGKLEDASARARNWQERSDRLKDALNKSKDDVSRRETDLREIRSELEGSREVVARLTAQLESVTERPKESRAADELTNKIRRLEAELVVARERATDSEGRVQSMREEVSLHQREQKNSTVETLAAQENVRLERSRREQLVTELEDARTRLTQAYEDLRRAQDDAAAQRVEAERAKLAADRVSEQLGAKNRELEGAREKELRLADARSESMQAVEGLQGELKRARGAMDAAEESARAREAEKIAALRTLDLETQKHTTVDRDYQNARGKLDELTAELREREASLGAAETELTATKAAATRLQRDIETLANSERTWREMAQSYETRLNDTLSNVDGLSEQVARLDAEKEQEVARFHRLEKDLTTAVGAERSAREQAQQLLADKEAKLREAIDDREKLLERRDELEASLGDLKKVRESDAAALDSAQGFRGALESRVDALTRERDAAELKLGELLKVHDEARSGLESAHSYRSALDSRLSQLEHDVHDLTDRLAERSAAAERLAEELAVALERADTLQGDVAGKTRASEERIAQISKERDQARQETARLSGQLDQGRQRVAELAQRSARLETEIKDLKARIGELEAQAKDRQERLQETQVKFTHAQADAAKLQREQAEELTELRARLDSSRASGSEEVEGLRSRLTTAETALEDTKKQHVDAERGLETVRDSLAATEAARAKLETTLEADRKEAATGRGEVERALEDAKASVARLEARQDVLANESKVLQHELEVQHKRYQDLELSAREGAQVAEEERKAEREKAQRELGEAKEAADHAQQAAEGAASQRLSMLQSEIEHFKTDRLELEGRLTAAQQHGEHLDAELAEAAEVRAREAQLREAAEAERDQFKAELDSARSAAATANEWVVGGRSENEKLERQMKTAQGDVDRTRDELANSRKAVEQLQEELARVREQSLAQQKTIEERDREKVELGDQLTREKAELVVAKQQTDAAKIDVTRGAEEQQKTKTELDELQKQLDVQAQAQRDEALAKNQAQAQEVQALREQLESVKKEVDLAKHGTERAQSEARGHQTGKLQLQKELDGLRGELNTSRASLAAAGGEAKAITEAKQAAQGELSALQSRAQTAEERAAKLESGYEAQSAELAALQERQVGMEAEISATRGAATGTSGELEATLAGRRQAEDMLIKMRTRYAELELQLSNELPQLRDQVSELMADNQMMDAERERLAGHVERLEATRTTGADSEKELKHRIDMLQRRVNAQDAELNALRRRASGLPGAAAPTQPGAPSALGRVALTKVPADKANVQGPRPTPRGHAPKGRLLAEGPDVPTVREPKPSSPRPSQPAQPGQRPIQTAVTPVMTPLTQEPVTKPGGLRPADLAATADDNVELEVFELELDENGDDEELLLLEEEASDPGPGSGTPPKKP